ncbi:hypothetical protein WMY93_010353 [Mugilogobius chulae]|uniref:Cadherin domain-containing protein n=1 Tax=Mugilogobius chulae TaxID=88201 RepID=A0AAW0PG67_9GOBI
MCSALRRIIWLLCGVASWGPAESRTPPGRRSVPSSERHAKMSAIINTCPGRRIPCLHGLFSCVSRRSFGPAREKVQGCRLKPQPFISFSPGEMSSVVVVVVTNIKRRGCDVDSSTETVQTNAPPPPLTPEGERVVMLRAGREDCGAPVREQSPLITAFSPPVTRRHGNPADKQQAANDAWAFGLKLRRKASEYTGFTGVTAKSTGAMLAHYNWLQSSHLSLRGADKMNGRGKVDINTRHWQMGECRNIQKVKRRCSYCLSPKEIMHPAFGGVIRTALPNMDRETRDQYVLVIQAKDMVGQMGGLSGTTSVTVTLTDVNDNPPRFPHKNYQYTVAESLPVHSVVARIKAADADIGSNFNVTTDEDTQDGVILLLRPLDFETKSSFSLRIEATNRHIDSSFLTLGPFSDTTSVKVTVEDVNEPPVFSAPLSRMVVSEDARVGTSIGRVSAHDPDNSNSAIRYSIDRNTDLERFFNVDALSGVISTAKPLDREANSVHNLTIFAIESQDPTQIGRGVALVSVLDINDNAPVFAIDYETLLCENSMPGQGYALHCNWANELLRNTEGLLDRMQADL